MTGTRTSKFFIDSNLSSVPPVWPKPRPDIIGTATPPQATSGANAIEIPSPTPPVECLSTLGSLVEEKSSRPPEWAIALVKRAVSLSERGFKKQAIKKAESW